ncbi:MAG: hypothetical protein L0G27_05465 [Paracoccus sp. (in: a-proteobacteria)]|nr:hypothetical protein [Paracoccus sp. (in: a-proteobacteria)]
MSDTDALLKEIEAAAEKLGIAPSTVGKLAGQGGHFYHRLSSGCRVWPETALKVRGWISAELKRQKKSSEGAA